jgi:hypothetical protein
MVTPTKYERIRAHYIAGLALIPRHMHEGIIRYMENGIHPGDFMTAILADDLHGAIRLADHINMQWLKDWLHFMEDHLPADARGSYEHVRLWCESGGLNTQEKAERQNV